MKNCWLLIGDITGDVKYGVDESFYLIGIYGNKDSAEAAMQNYKESNSVFTTEDGDMLYEAPYGYGVMSGKSMEVMEFVCENPIKYSDFTYRIYEFNKSPVYIGGASYIE